METTLSVKVPTRIYRGKKLGTNGSATKDKPANFGLFTNSTSCSQCIGTLLETLYPADHVRQDPFHAIHFLERGLAPEGKTDQRVGFGRFHPKG